jgi:hypothetical protein
MARGLAWRLAGKLMVGGGALLFIASLFLPYIDNGVRSASAWELTTRSPVILTVVAGLALALAAISIFLEAPGLAMGTAGLSLYAFGQYFPIGARSYDAYGAGLWLGTASAIVMSVGSLLTLIGYRIEAASPEELVGDPGDPAEVRDAAQEPGGREIADRPERGIYGGAG